MEIYVRIDVFLDGIYKPVRETLIKRRFSIYTVYCIIGIQYSYYFRYQLLN